MSKLFDIPHTASYKPIHFGDVVSTIHACGDAFGQVGAILRAVANQSGLGDDQAALIGAARHIATDFENLAHATADQIEGGGIVGGGV